MGELGDSVVVSATGIDADVDGFESDGTRDDLRRRESQDEGEVALGRGDVEAEAESGAALSPNALSVKLTRRGGGELARDITAPQKQCEAIALSSCKACAALPD